MTTIRLTTTRFDSDDDDNDYASFVAKFSIDTHDLNKTVVRNNFQALQCDDDDDENVDEDDECADLQKDGTKMHNHTRTTTQTSTRLTSKGKNWNKKQSRRRQEQKQHHNDDNEQDLGETTRDAVAREDAVEMEWHEDNDNHTNQCSYNTNITNNRKHVTYCDGYTSRQQHGSSPNGANCNCSSKDACSDPHLRQSHWPSSNCQCVFNCSTSSGLSAAVLPSLVSRPYEWPLDEGETWEVMSPREEPPPAKLHSSPIPLYPSTWDIGHLSGHSLAPPSKGTCPSPVEGRGAQRIGRAFSQMDIEATCKVTHVERPILKSLQVSPGEAQTQGCGWVVSYADAVPSVVPATHDHREQVPDHSGLPEGSRRAQKVVACDGFRRPALHHSNARLEPQGSWFPGGGGG